MTQAKHNNENLKDKRRFLRNHSTSAESALWLMIKGRQLSGFRFRRQYSVGPYILDFYCPEVRLAIELDGARHYELSEGNYDETRTKYLKSEHNITVLRFENKLIFDFPNEVKCEIVKALSHLHSVVNKHAELSPKIVRE